MRDSKGAGRSSKQGKITSAKANQKRQLQHTGTPEIKQFIVLLMLRSLELFKFHFYEYYGID